MHVKCFVLLFLGLYIWVQNIAEMNNTTSAFELSTLILNSAYPKNATSIQHRPIDMQDSARMILRFMYGLVFVVGIFGNSMVCYIITKQKRRKRIHILILNLAVSDLFVLLIYLPLQLILFENNMQWKFGYGFCKITYSLIPISFFSSIGTLVAITRERYVAVISPMNFNLSLKTRWSLMLIWSVSVLLTVPLMYASGLKNGYCMEANWPNTDIENAYWIMVFCVQFALPVCMISVTYIIIFMHLNINSLPTEKIGYYSRRLRIRRRQHNHMTIMTIVLVFVYVICMLPQHVVFFWNTYGNLQTVPYSLYVFLLSNLMAITNSSLNPVVYGTLNKEMKRGIKRVLHCNARNDNEYEGTTTSRKTTAL